METADEVINRLKVMGERLLPYTFPRNDESLEADITVLKTADLTIDGYEVTLHYSKADYAEHNQITFQVMGRNFPFLPFSLVIKLARKALGMHKLYLAEVYRDNRKIYCWTLITDKTEQPLSYPTYKDKSHFCEYEGFAYTYMDASHLNFY